MINLDYVIRRWDTKKFIIVEEKMYDGMIPFAQRATLQQLDAIFRAFGGGGDWEYLGFFLVRLSRTTPDDSEVIRINHETVTIDQLKEHLSIERLHAKPIDGVKEWKAITK